MIRAFDLDEPQLAAYRALDRRRAPGPSFIVEGELPVRRLLASAFEVRSVVCTPAHLERLRDELPETLPVFVGPRERLASLVGFDFHRGCLACGTRPSAGRRPDLDLLTRLGGRERLTIVAAEGLADPRNLGALIRNARAFAVDLVIVDERGADPLARLAIRVSVGNVFRVPLLISEDLPATLSELRESLAAELLAATPAAGSVDLHALERGARRILVVGNEGQGLSAGLLALADRRVRIPIDPAADSLNVAAATAVLLYGLASGQ